MNKELRVTQRAPGRWDIENLTDEELMAIREAIGMASLPASRNLQELKKQIGENPIF